MGILGHHLIAAFMPLLSEASRSGRGVLSLTSTPAQTSRLTAHVVACRVRDGDHAIEGGANGVNPPDHFFAVMVLRMGLLGEDDLQAPRRATPRVSTSRSKPALVSTCTYHINETPAEMHSSTAARAMPYLPHTSLPKTF